MKSSSYFNHIKTTLILPQCDIATVKYMKQLEVNDIRKKEHRPMLLCKWEKIGKNSWFGFIDNKLYAKFERIK